VNDEALQDQWIIGASIVLFLIAVVVWWCKSIGVRLAVVALIFEAATLKDKERQVWIPTG